MAEAASAIPDDAELLAQAARLGELLLERGWTVTTAESCTGGWVAKVLTDVAGSSQWFERGFVTYSNEAKAEMLGVTADDLDVHGAVSEAVVRAMARGAAAVADSDLAVSVSGIAGPRGAMPGKPVGTVWFAWSRPGHIQTDKRVFDGDRDAVRRQSVAAAIAGLVTSVQA